MVIQNAITGVLLMLSIGCVVRASVLFGNIAQQVNRLVAKEKQVNPWDRRVFFRILREYRQLNPNGTVILKMNLWAGIGFALAAVAVIYWFFSGAASVGYIPTHR